jgi:integrase/recombinase XerC
MNILTNPEWITRFEAYLRRRFPNRSTAKHYTSDLRLFVQRHPGPLSEITPQDVDAFVDQQRVRGLAPSTVKRRVAALKTFFDFLAETLEEANRPNPVSMRRHAGRQPQLLPRDLSDAEVEGFVAMVKKPRDLAMVALMLYAGLRVSEVAALHPADIIVPEEPEAPIRLRVMGKGRKERMAYLCREGYQHLARYLRESSPSEPQAPLFRNRLGAPISVAGIQERIQHYAQRSGIEVTCHRLRHTYGRWMAESEMPVLALARLLGHSSVQTTQRYIDGADPQVRRSYEAAMEHQTLPAGESAAAGETLPAVVASTGKATVVREVPPPFDGTDWMPAWPAWLREGCLDWLKHQWYNWKPSRRLRYAHIRLSDLRAFWRWQLARRTFQGWDDLTSADIAAFMEAQLGRGLNAKTVKSRLDRLYAVLRYLETQGRLLTLPERPALTLPDPLPRYLPPQEVMALEAEVARREAEAQAEERLNLALYYLLSHGGLRISEALDLQVKDLDLAARRVRVREGKGRRDRVVYLTAKAAEALSRYLQTVPHAAEDLVLSWRGRPLSYDQARIRIRRLGEAAGVEGLSPQRLRHTYATQLLNNGVSIEALRRLMGHENLNTTLIYARLADSTLEKQYRAAMERVTNSQVNSV